MISFCYTLRLTFLLSLLSFLQILCGFEKPCHTLFNLTLPALQFLKNVVEWVIIMEPEPLPMVYYQFWNWIMLSLQCTKENAYRKERFYAENVALSMLLAILLHSIKSHCALTLWRTGLANLKQHIACWVTWEGTYKADSLILILACQC